MNTNKAKNLFLGSVLIGILFLFSACGNGGTGPNNNNNNSNNNNSSNNNNVSTDTNTIIVTLTLTTATEQAAYIWITDENNMPAATITHHINKGNYPNNNPPKFNASQADTPDAVSSATINTSSQQYNWTMSEAQNQNLTNTTVTIHIEITSHAGSSGQSDYRTVTIPISDKEVTNINSQSGSFVSKAAVVYKP